MRTFRIVAVVVAVVAALGVGVGPASAKPYVFRAGQAVTVTVGR
jgi:hypothetical protein